MTKFLWGSGTAAYQCEGGWNSGGRGVTQWDDFSHNSKMNINNVTGDVSSDFYHHYDEDIKMMAEGGQNAFRFSIAWSRIIPDGTGKVNQEGIDFYKKVLASCKKYGVEPFVTLYHYDMPLDLFKNGGWENRDTVSAYLTYAKVCFYEFHDEIKYWTTINEPNYDTLCSYAIGNYPPYKHNLEERWHAMYNMMLASALAIKEFRNQNYQGQIGVVSDSYSIETLEDNDDYRKAKDNADLFFNRSVNDTCVLGKWPEEFLEKLKADNYDLSWIKKNDAEIFSQGKVDFLGVNAYDRILVKPYHGKETVLTNNNTGDGEIPKNMIANWFQFDEDKNVKKNAWGMEIYPKSVYTLLKDLNDRYPNTPFVITENGVGLYDKIEDGQIDDKARIEYQNGFVEWMKKAMSEGCNVFGYFIWSTMDLYSWVNGYTKRYGLVYVDYENNQKRIPKKSFYWYKDLIEKEENINEDD